MPSRLQEQGGWAALTGPPEQESAKWAEGSWGSRKCLALDREGLEPGIQSSLHPTPIQLCTFQDCWEPRAVHSLDSADGGTEQLGQAELEDRVWNTLLCPPWKKGLFLEFSILGIDSHTPLGPGVRSEPS